MAEFDCPTDQALRNYMLGDCSDAISEEIEGHLACCATCEATISQFDAADDTLLRHLPLAGATAAGAAATPPGWVDVLRRQPPVGDRGDVPNGSIDQDFQQAESDAAPRLPDSCGNYELLGVLGRGGMGVVFLARHRQLDRRVALKVVRPDALSSLEARRRFQREIRILGGLNHPGIVMATDAGTVGAGAYLVMELIEGADLGRIARDGGPLAIEAACEAGRQIAEALAAAHASGAIHRDVKPSNIMVDRGGRVRLLDFGLAHMTMTTHHSGETSVGRLLGTLDYMAPEQADGRRQVDARADLYGLGATLFFLLTGRPPHGARADRSLLEHLRAVSHDDAPRVSSIRVDIPAELDTLVARLLCRDPDGRPQSASEVAAALSRWAGGNLAARVADLETSLPSPQAESADGAAARQSLAKLLGASATAPFGGAMAPSMPPGRPRRFWRWLALAPIAGVILAGITIWLKTSQGTLKIESEVDNVTVEARNERDQIQELKIKKGKNEIVLDAGEYRVRLAGSHDGVDLDRDVITLRRGDATIARITRVADQVQAGRGKAQSSISVIDQPQDQPVLVQRMYQGKTESDWKRHFTAETEPVAKLKAASALLALSGELPPQSQVERALDVGEAIVRAAFGDDNFEFAFGIGGHPPAKSPAASRAQRWRFNLDMPLNQEFNHFVNQSSEMLSKIPAENLTRGLSQAVLKGNPARAAFAAAFLQDALTLQIKSDPQAVQVIAGTLDVPLTGLDRSAVCLLVQSRYANEMSAEQRGKVVSQLRALAAFLVPAPQGRLRYQMRNALLQVSALLNGKEWPSDLSELIAQVVLNEMIEEPYTVSRRFGADIEFTKDRVSPYRNEQFAVNRAQMQPFLGAWVKTANTYLEAHPDRPADQGTRSVVKSLELVLPFYSQVDDWPVEKTGALFSDFLRGYYTDTPDNLTDQPVKELLPSTPAALLTQIVRVTGQIPDFVRKGHPRSTAVVKKWKELARGLNNEGDLPRFEGNRFTPQFLDEAPYEAVRLCVGENQLLPDKRQIVVHGLPCLPTPTELLYAVSGVRDDRNNRRELPTDPLLVLAILADLTGESQAQDDRIATLFTQGLAAKMFKEHLEALLTSPLQARTFALAFLQKIAAGSKSEKLTAAVGDLLAPVAAGAGKPRPHDGE